MDGIQAVSYLDQGKENLGNANMVTSGIQLLFRELGLELHVLHAAIKSSCLASMTLKP
jgi:hypothetical protein